MAARYSILTVLLFAFVSLAYGQARNITGTVTEDSGFPLPGVNIQIQGTLTGTITGINGTYSLQASTGDALVFTFVGYIQQTITVADQNVIDVTLAEDVALLDEIVVVGYGTQRRANITGSAQRVVADEANVGLINSPEQLIQGRVAGVTVIQNGGAPGAPVTVRIRGGTSISASNQPLYVIDGVPIDTVAAPLR